MPSQPPDNLSPGTKHRCNVCDITGARHSTKGRILTVLHGVVWRSAGEVADIGSSSAGFGGLAKHCVGLDSAGQGLFELVSKGTLSFVQHSQSELAIRDIKLYCKSPGITAVLVRSNGSRTSPTPTVCTSDDCNAGRKYQSFRHLLLVAHAAPGHSNKLSWCLSACLHPCCQADVRVRLLVGLLAVPGWKTCCKAGYKAAVLREGLRRGLLVVLLVRCL